VVVGVVNNPILRELYTATDTGGAFLNGTPIRVSETVELRHALLATEIGTLRDNESVAAIFERVCAAVEPSRSIRQCGSCAMNMVGTASGRLDAMFEIGFGGPWDVAAASVIVTEAGGVVLDPTGAPFDVMCRRVLCGTPAIAQKLAEILKDGKLSSKEPGPPASAAL
jgi:inositol-phosphate phosphatase / L-galactose 1-phosphate phosphatase